MTDRRPRDPVDPAAWGSVIAPVAGGRPTRRIRRNGELDAYTAIAVMASVVFTVYQFCNVNDDLYRGTAAHSVLASLGAAVPWLFVVIGYRMFEPIAHAYLTDLPTINTRSLLVRSAVALVPAYYVAVLVVWFCRQDRLPGDWHDLLEHLTFTQVFDARRIFYTDGPAWAVSVTVYFVLALAIVNAALMRVRPEPNRTHRLVVLTAPCATLAALSLAWKAWSSAGAHRPVSGSSTTWYGPLANLDSFALGMAAAVVLVAFEGRAPALPRYPATLRLGALIVLAAAFTTRHVDRWTEVLFTTACSIGFAVLVVAAVLAAATPRTPATPERLRGFGWLATIAYGTYLWREPVLLSFNGWGIGVSQHPDAFVRDVLIVLVLSLLAGWLSYLVIERPADNLYLFLSNRLGTERQRATTSAPADRSTGDPPRLRPAPMRPPSP